jgi:hypothetical protein
MPYGPRYSGDPRWITAKYGHCAKCGRPLTGKPAVYFPNGKVCFCQDCGRPEMQAFESAAFDEAVMAGHW